MFLYGQRILLVGCLARKEVSPYPNSERIYRRKKPSTHTTHNESGMLHYVCGFISFLFIPTSIYSALMQWRAAFCTFLRVPFAFYACALAWMHRASSFAVPYVLCDGVFGLDWQIACTTFLVAGIYAAPQLFSKRTIAVIVTSRDLCGGSVYGVSACVHCL